jgi:hypothetical protein
LTLAKQKREGEIITMLYMPLSEALTMDELAAQYCECLIGLEALDVAERCDWQVPEEIAYERQRLQELKAALGDEMRQRVSKPRSQASVETFDVPIHSLSLNPQA